MNTVQVALYARVSSEQQSEAKTIESQLADLRGQIAARSLTLVSEQEFIDDGYSGATLIRPALERLRDVAAAGGFFVIRQHGRLQGELLGKRRKSGRTETGVVHEQALRIRDGDGRERHAHPTAPAPPGREEAAQLSYRRQRLPRLRRLPPKRPLRTRALRRSACRRSTTPPKRSTSRRLAFPPRPASAKCHGEAS